MAERDRLVVAWERRRDVHAWISANPGAAMPAIKLAFVWLKEEAVRGIVRRLCADRFIRADGNGYLAAREFDQAVTAMRERLREVGIAAAPALADASRGRARRSDGTFASGPVVTLGRRYINRPWKKPPIRNQGGQGACVDYGRRREVGF